MLNCWALTKMDPATMGRRVGGYLGQGQRQRLLDWLRGEGLAGELVGGVMETA
jgi:hypothetical protein